MNGKVKMILILHSMLLLFSFDAVLSKLASGFPFLSPGFCMCYAGMILILGIYAVGWQQIIKRLPLTVAFSNKAVTVIWGIIWGRLFFGEAITSGKVIGALLVITGIVMYATADLSVPDDLRLREDRSKHE